jgi:hypothetical protein
MMHMVAVVVVEMAMLIDRSSPSPSLPLLYPLLFLTLRNAYATELLNHKRDIHLHAFLRDCFFLRG